MLTVAKAVSGSSLLDLPIYMIYSLHSSHTTPLSFLTPSFDLHLRFLSSSFRFRLRSYSPIFTVRSCFLKLNQSLTFIGCFPILILTERLRSFTRFLQVLVACLSLQDSTVLQRRPPSFAFIRFATASLLSNIERNALLYFNIIFSIQRCLPSLSVFLSQARLPLSL